MVRGRGAKLFQIQPEYLIAKNSIKYKIDLNRIDINTDNIGVYGYAARSDRWGFITSSNDGIISFDGKGLGRLALIEDSTPPKITRLRPKGRIKSRQPNLSCIISDDLSGVNTNGRLIMEIDGIWVPAEFDNDTKSFSYKVKNNLRSGKHTLKITAYDRQGNVKTATRVFTIL